MIEAILAMNTGGLANRVQNVESCILLSRELGVPLTALWTQNKQLRAPFDALFKAPEGVTIVEAPDWASVKSGIEAFDADVTLDWNNHEGTKDVCDAEAAEAESKWRRPDIRLYSRFYCGNRRGRLLELADPISETVEATAHLARGKIGVHIRRGDHDGARNQSPDFAFLRLLDNIAPERHFLLCTDDDDVEALIVQRYPGRVHLRLKSSRDRNEEIAAVEALVDMTLLSQTDAIIGSFGSTFSNCAAYWGNILVHHVRIGS